MQPDYNGQLPQQNYQMPQMNMPPDMSGQPKHHSSRGLITLLILFVILTIVASGFGLWAFGERNEYKNNVDEKVETAAAAAVEKAENAKEADFAERLKSPHDTYQGPAAFGSVGIKYPRTWSAFVTEEDKGSTPIDGYFHPNVIPGTRSGTAYALRLQVLSSDYARELARFDSDSKSGKVRVSAIELQGVTGARIDGEIEKDRQGSTVLLPIRDKTLRLTTESEAFMDDFNKTILTNLTFSP
jgi:hypothetical protein